MLVVWCWWCGVSGVVLVLVMWCWWCGVGDVVLVVWCVGSYVRSGGGCSRTKQ